MSEYIISKTVKNEARHGSLVEAREAKQRMGVKGKKYHIYKIEYIL